MKLPKSKVGLTFSLFYLLGSTYLILSQGLFGESFIAIVLGFPWSFLIILSNGHTIVSDSSPLFTPFLYAWLLGPIIVNLVLLYWVGIVAEKVLSRSPQNP